MELCQGHAEGVEVVPACRVLFQEEPNLDLAHFVLEKAEFTGFVSFFVCLSEFVLDVVASELPENLLKEAVVVVLLCV